MAKIVLTSMLVFLLGFSVCGWTKQETPKDFVSVKSGPDGYTLSVNADNVSAGSVIRQVG